MRNEHAVDLVAGNEISPRALPCSSSPLTDGHSSQISQRH